MELKEKFWDHLDELRSRLVKGLIGLVVGFAIAFWFADRILLWLIRPSPLVGQSLSALEPGAVFVQSLQIGLWGGVILTLPFLFYQLWAFLRPGLKLKEAKALIVALSAGSLLFCVGALFAYYLVIPQALAFFLQYQQRFGIAAAWTLEHYLNFVCSLLIGFGIAFELPFIMVVLVWLGLLRAQAIAAKRPYIIIAIAVIAAALTPPDVISQLMLMIPLLVLFEISIVISKRFSV